MYERIEMTEGIKTVDALLDVLSLLGFSDSEVIAGSLCEASEVRCML